MPINTMRTNPQESDAGGGAVKYAIYNGKYLGTAEWAGPGEVTLVVDDEGERAWLRHFFRREECFLGGSLDGAEMVVERGDSSPEAFERATYRLAAYAYSMRAQQTQGADA
jgi:hypothetical protein